VPERFVVGSRPVLPNSRLFVSCSLNNSILNIYHMSEEMRALVNTSGDRDEIWLDLYRFDIKLLLGNEQQIDVCQQRSLGKS
jgi:hypothetical protein